MTFSTVSSKGQITLPVEIRRMLGIKARDRITLESVGDTVVIRRVRNLLELEGFLGKALPMEEEKRLMEEAVARHVMGLDE
jgi:antitoxin PrlF